MNIIVNYSYKGIVDKYVSTDRTSFKKVLSDLKAMSPNIHIINVDLLQKEKWFN